MSEPLPSPQRRPTLLSAEPGTKARRVRARELGQAEPASPLGQPPTRPQASSKVEGQHVLRDLWTIQNRRRLTNQKKCEVLPVALRNVRNEFGTGQAQSSPGSSLAPSWL